MDLYTLKLAENYALVVAPTMHDAKQIAMFMLPGNWMNAIGTSQGFEIGLQEGRDDTSGLIFYGTKLLI